MTQRKYAGTWTALITPFKQDGSLDEKALRLMVERQIKGGITGVVPMGTTGESPTLTGEEAVRLFEIVMDQVAGRVRVMAGTGSNCTASAVHHTENAKKAGVDCCLVVCPYYNKPTPAGLIQHYHAIADVGLPVIVYNIKGRTGINIDTDTLMQIAEHERVVGVKEASGNLDQMKEVIARRSDDFTVLCGDDGLTLDLISAGGDGVVSVASNIIPDRVVEMVKEAMAGNRENAKHLNNELSRIFKEIFIESNPIPVKYIMHRMGYCDLTYRLPMCPPTEKSRGILDDLIHSYKLI